MKKFFSSLFGTFTGPAMVGEEPRRAEGLELPVLGEWQVFWGGQQADQNHHFDIPAQRYALDLCISTDHEGYESYRAEGKRNEDYYCWAEPVLAPFDGKVVVRVDGVPDNPPGEMNEQMIYGNTVMLQRSDGIVAVLAHLRNGSIRPLLEQGVKCGDQIAECGNSGNSSEPHLHFHIQSEIGFEKGVGLLPIFSRLIVGGEARNEHSPVKNEKIKSEQGGGGQPATRSESK